MKAIEGAECLFSGTLAIAEVGASAGRRENAVKNLLSFCFLVNLAQTLELTAILL